jgi:hypothetical protein
MVNWKGYGRKKSWPSLRYYPIICLEGLRKTTKDLSQDTWPQVPPEYGLISRPRARWLSFFFFSVHLNFSYFILITIS